MVWYNKLRIIKDYPRFEMMDNNLLSVGFVWNNWRLSGGEVKDNSSYLLKMVQKYKE